MSESKPYHSNATFWLTYCLILTATAWFVGSSFVGMNAIIDGIENENSKRSVETLQHIYKSGQVDHNLLAWISLEYDALENRQSRADSLLATRTWLRFMNAAFGSILVMSGAIFILSRVRVGKAEVEATTADFKIAIASSSPGIFMLFVGAFMVCAPLFTSQRIIVEDGAAYPAFYQPTTRIQPTFISRQEPLDTSSNVIGLSAEDRNEMCEAYKSEGIENHVYCNES